ncbi:hypothetical protein BKA93DRAFT_180085 [Sparassis latifolia]
MGLSTARLQQATWTLRNAKIHPRHDACPLPDVLCYKWHTEMPRRRHRPAREGVPVSSLSLRCIAHRSNPLRLPSGSQFAIGGSLNLPALQIFRSQNWSAWKNLPYTLVCRRRWCTFEPYDALRVRWGRSTYAGYIWLRISRVLSNVWCGLHFSFRFMQHISIIITRFYVYLPMSAYVLCRAYGANSRHPGIQHRHA